MTLINRSAKTGGGTDLNDGQVAPVADINTDMNAIFDDHNGNIDDDNIKAAASIDPTKIGDYSDDAAESKEHDDPNAALATTLAEELQQLRYTIRQIKSGTTGNWQDDPDQTIWDIGRGYIDGYIMTTASSPDVTIAAGACKDSTNTQWLSGGAMTKQTDATWAEGTAAGGMNDTEAGAVAADTWYHVFAIKVPGANGDVDYIFDSNLDGTNLLLDAAVQIWTSAEDPLFRRIGSILMDGTATNIVDFVQDGDEFLWADAAAQDHDDATSDADPRKAYALSVPPDVKVRANVIVSVTDNNASHYYVTSPDQADEDPSLTTGLLSGYAHSTGDHGTGHFWIRTNTSKQIYVRTDADTADVAVVTLGWIDQRGKNA
jgi:hypothetical protein